MGAFIINPGTGPVLRARWQSANANMKALVAEVREIAGVHMVCGTVVDEETGVAIRNEGRYQFGLLGPHPRRCLVEMPGIPLARVRWNGSDQDPWGFPRLYVDGSSWLWKFAVSAVVDRMGGLTK